MRKLFALVTSLFFATALLGQGFKVDFLDSSDGLSNSSVIKVFQDSDGVMWLGTWDGLNSWNGRNFNVLKSDRDDPSTISGNVISVMCIFFFFSYERLSSFFHMKR